MHSLLTHRQNVRQLNLQSHQLILKQDLGYPSKLQSLSFFCYSVAQHSGFHCEDRAVPKNKISQTIQLLRIHHYVIPNLTHCVTIT